MSVLMSIVMGASVEQRISERFDDERERERRTTSCSIGMTIDTVLNISHAEESPLFEEHVERVFRSSDTHGVLGLPLLGRDVLVLALRDVDGFSGSRSRCFIIFALLRRLAGLSSLLSGSRRSPDESNFLLLLLLDRDLLRDMDESEFLFDFDLVNDFGERIEWGGYGE